MKPRAGTRAAEWDIYARPSGRAATSRLFAWQVANPFATNDENKHMRARAGFYAGNEMLKLR